MHYLSENAAVDLNVLECDSMFQAYFGTNIHDLIRSFPQFVFSERGRGRWRDGRFEAHKETLVDKLTQHACAMLT